MCYSLLLSFITLTEYTSYAIKFSPFLLNICEFQRKVQPNTVSTIEVGVYVLSPLLSLILSIWRWKDLSCCFLLLHYLLPCAALLAGFISDFAGCFWGSLWNVFLTPNNPLPAFPLCSLPLLWKQKKEKKNNNLRFSKRNNPESEIKVDPTLSLGRRMLFLFRWLTWKENRGASLSLALLASLAQYRRTSNDWLTVICVSREAARALFLRVPLWMR